MTSNGLLQTLKGISLEGPILSEDQILILGEDCDGSANKGTY